MDGLTGYAIGVFRPETVIRISVKMILIIARNQEPANVEKATQVGYVTSLNVGRSNEHMNYFKRGTFTFRGILRY